MVGGGATKGKGPKGAKRKGWGGGEPKGVMGYKGAPRNGPKGGEKRVGGVGGVLRRGPKVESQVAQKGGSSTNKGGIKRWEWPQQGWGTKGARAKGEGGGTHIGGDGGV